MANLEKVGCPLKRKDAHPHAPSVAMESLCQGTLRSPWQSPHHLFLNLLMILEHFLSSQAFIKKGVAGSRETMF